MSNNSVEYPTLDGLSLPINTRLHVKQLFGLNTKLIVESSSSRQEVLLGGDGSVVLQQGLVYHLSDSAILDISQNSLTSSKMRKMAAHGKRSRSRTDSVSVKKESNGTFLDVQNFMGTLRTRKSRSSNQLSSLADTFHPPVSTDKRSKTTVDEIDQEDDAAKKNNKSGTLFRKKKTSKELVPEVQQISGSRNTLSQSRKMGSIQEGVNSMLFGSRKSSRASIVSNSIMSTFSGFALPQNDQDANSEPNLTNPKQISKSEFQLGLLTESINELGVDEENNVMSSYSIADDRESDMQSLFSLKVSPSMQKSMVDETLDDVRKSVIEISKLPSHEPISGKLRYISESPLQEQDWLLFKLENYRLFEYADEKCLDENESTSSYEIPFATCIVADLGALSFHVIMGNSNCVVTLGAETKDELLFWISKINSFTMNALHAKVFECEDQSSKESHATAAYRRELQMLNTSLKISLNKRKDFSDHLDEETDKKTSRINAITRSGSASSGNSSTLSHKERGEAKILRWALSLNENGKLVEKSHPKASTLAMMLEKAVPFEASLDMDYVNFLITSYRHVARPSEFLDLLLQRYMFKTESPTFAARDEYLCKWRPVIRIRVFTFIKRWMKVAFCDFYSDKQASEMLTKFLDAVVDGQIMPGSYGDLSAFDNEKFVKIDIKKVGEQMKQLFQFNYDEYEQNLRYFESFSETEDNHKRKLTDLISIALDVEIAHELTRLDYEKYKSIKPIEFFLHVWSNKDSPHIKFEIKNLQSLIQRFNIVSYWVATEICTQPELKNRILVVERMINIAKELRRLNNFNSLLAVMSGLNVASVQRLKATWESLPQKSMKVYKELEDAVSPQNNFGRYRDLISQFELEFLEQLSSGTDTPNTPGSITNSPIGTPVSSPNVMQLAILANTQKTTSLKERSLTQLQSQCAPAIPIISLFMKDLLFMSDGNPKMIGDLDMINYSKLRTMMISVDRITLYQRGKYELMTISEETREFCSNLRALKEAALYKYSTLAEPKAGDAGQRLIAKWVSDNV